MSQRKRKSTMITQYKGFEIVPQFVYTNGKTDFNIYYNEREYAMIHPSSTLEGAKEAIDFLIQSWEDQNESDLRLYELERKG